MTTTAEWRDGWYRVPYEVTWRDLDGVGHVNNAVYFTFFESARIAYWLDLLEVERPGPDSIGFIVAHASCDFRAQLGLRQKIEIRVRVGEIRNSSFDFLYEIATEAGDLAATGKVISVLFD
ncbi:MAG: acyl-CoA thioesterase, partial [Thermoanaerobaculia bacterium]|nr:acyl-CoA thioesterase [Thermoanaerobaculia bacterium]